MTHPHLTDDDRVTLMEGFWADDYWAKHPEADAAVMAEKIAATVNAIVARRLANA